MGNVITSIASAIIEGPEGMKPSYMSICGVNMFYPTAATPLLEEVTFQFWPETVVDNIEVGWEFKNIPGGSHALAQWGANGGRTISFDVKLSRFMRPLSKKSLLDFILDPFSLNSPISEFPSDNRPYNVNVKGMIRYLRLFCYPSYSEMEGGYQGAIAPPIAILNIPNFGLNEDGSDSIYAVMTGCDVTYQLAFPDGTPRYAVVSLTFKQVVQNVTDGNIYFVGMDAGFDHEELFEPLEEDAVLGGGHGGDIEGKDPNTDVILGK